MPRGEQLLRQWNLLKRLQTRGEGSCLEELERSFRVCRRTLQRDLEMLEEVGFPIEAQEADYGKRYWRLQHNLLQAGPLLLTLTEAVALRFAMELFGPLAGTHYADAMDGLIAKIQHILPERALEHFSDLDEVIHLRSTGRTNFCKHRDVIRKLDEAIRQRRSTEIVYRSLSRSKPTTTLLDPYGLIYHDGELFILGHSHVANERRIYKISRIQSTRLTRRPFRRPRGFDLEDQFRHSFGVFRSVGRPRSTLVRFTGMGARLIEERLWHESQHVEWCPSERTLFEPDPEQPEALLATFRLSDFTEFKRWLRSFGDTAEVLRPDWLRAEMHQELLAAASLYSR